MLIAKLELHNLEHKNPRVVVNTQYMQVTTINV